MASRGTRSTESKLEALRRVVEWQACERTEAAGFWDFVRGRDDPKVRLLESEGSVKDHEIAGLKLEVAGLKLEVARLKLEMSKDPKVIEARRRQESKEIQDRIDARLEQERVEKENALKLRDEAERNDPSLKAERLKREERERELSAEIAREDRRNGVTPSFGGQSWA